MVAVKAHFDGKVIVPDEPLDLPRDQKLVVHIEPVPARPQAAGSVLDWLAENPVEDPALPTDLSHQHDHYLYGTPKREP